MFSPTGRPRFGSGQWEGDGIQTQEWLKKILYTNFCFNRISIKLYLFHRKFHENLPPVTNMNVDGACLRKGPDI